MEVGQLGLANDFGLYDMHGNIWEWCQDYWNSSYNNKPEELKNNGSIAWTEGNGNRRILRGGSYFSIDQNSCRSAFRLNSYPDDRYSYNNGFRVVSG